MMAAAGSKGEERDCVLARRTGVGPGRATGVASWERSTLAFNCGVLLFAPVTGEERLLAGAVVVLGVSTLRDRTSIVYLCFRLKGCVCPASYFSQVAVPGQTPVPRMSVPYLRVAELLRPIPRGGAALQPVNETSPGASVAKSDAAPFPSRPRPPRRPDLPVVVAAPSKPATSGLDPAAGWCR
jgi:hypothetical protein